MKSRWKIGLFVSSLVSFVCIFLSVLPHLIDLEAYKPGMVKAVRDATGRELVIDGSLKLTLFPVPGIGAGKVHFANAVGAVGAQMIDVQWVAVRPSWRALLQGHFEVGTLTLYRPTIVLETDATGKPNWQFETPTADVSNTGLHLALGRVSLVEGTITYTDPLDGTKFSAQDVKAGFTVDSFDGPFEIDGSATVNGIPLKLYMGVKGPTAKGHEAEVLLKVASGDLIFKGDLETLSMDSAFQGHLVVNTGELNAFINSVSDALGSKSAFDARGVGSFSYDGDIEVARDHIATRNFDVKMGKDEAKGSLSLSYSTTTTLDGRVSLSRLDINKWIEIFSRPIELKPETAKAVAAAAVSVAKATAVAKVATVIVDPPLPSQISAHVNIDIAEALYNEGTMRDLSATFELKKGAVQLPRFKAVLPGDMKIDADPEKGTFSLSAPHLRETLEWLGIATAGIPTGKLKTLKVASKLTETPEELKFTDGTFNLDSTPGLVDGAWSFGSHQSIDLQVEMEQLDLDSYMPTSSTPTDQTAHAPINKASAVRAPSASLFALGLRCKVGQLLFRGKTLNHVQGHVMVQGNSLKLSDFKVADLMGSKIAFGGSVVDMGTAPHYDASFTVDTPDADLLLAYAGLPNFIPGTIGPARTSGRVEGTLEALAVHDVEVHILSTDVRASGSLTLNAPVQVDFPKFSLRTKDAGALLAAVRGQPIREIGSLAATGSLKVSSEHALFTGALDAWGTPMNGTLDAILGERPRIAATLKVPGTIDIDNLLSSNNPSSSPQGAPSHGQNAAAEPLNLSTLRSFDATLSLSASAMSVAALRIDHADLQATLADGVLKISKLTGQFFKGAVALAGTIDASRNELTLDAAGDLRGISLADMLRSTTGGNTFGPADYRIVVEGKLDAIGINLKGRGTSPAQLREGLAGTATLSGTVRAAMSNGAQSFAKFATGVGSLFSDELRFDSLLLKSFINNENAMSGRIKLSGGMVALENQTVQGQNATAVITSHNRLADGTTDTMIRVSGGKDQFVVTVKGKLETPKINAVKGPKQ